MIYYPLTVLIAAGIREFCLISTEEDLPRYEALFGSGEKWGLSFDYRVQPKPEGIAQAFIIADSFVGDDDVCLSCLATISSLAVTIFLSSGPILQRWCPIIFAYVVRDPRRYGVIEF